ncbi:MAG: tyrosine-type recombinase/integrase [Stellaceae bacterium]
MRRGSVIGDEPTNNGQYPDPSGEGGSQGEGGAGHRLNKKEIESLPIPERHSHVTFFGGAKLQGDAAPRGFGVRVTPNGTKAFVLDYRFQRKQYRITIGRFPDWSALRAVRRGRELRQQVDRGENPLKQLEPAPRVRTIGAMLDDFMAQHATKLRTRGEYHDTFERLVKPRLGSIGLYELRRSEIMALLGEIAARNGEAMADRTLSYFRSACNWWALRDDDFSPPFVRGMARTKPAQRARTRILTDDEIRAVWAAAAVLGTFGAFVRILLLTGQRRDEVAGMRWAEIASDGIWTIPAERYKTARDHFVPLSRAAIAIVQAQSRRNDTDLVFPSSVLKPLSGFSQARLKLAKITGPLPPWTLHDLRRTARSLMARASVTDGVAERVLGHVVPGVRGVYDRHSYAAEKCDALEKLAAMIARILDPTPSTIAVLSDRRASGAA